MQYACVENGRVEYIGPLPKNLRDFGWFPATVIKEAPTTRKAEENEVTYIVDTLDKVIIVQRVRE